MAAGFSSQILDEIRSRVDIVEIVGQLTVHGGLDRLIGPIVVQRWPSRDADPELPGELRAVVQVDQYAGIIRALLGWRGQI